MLEDKQPQKPSQKERRALRKAHKKARQEERRLEKNKRELLEVKETCVNCDSFLALDQRYCSKCGGKRVYNRITARNLIEDFVDRFLNIENSFFKTFITLFKKPEDVIVSYIQGMRKKYLTAFSYFAIALTINGIYNFILRKWLMDDLFRAQTAIYDGSSNDQFQNDQFQEELLSAWMDTAMEYQSLFMFAAIPFLAILARVVFWNYKKINLTEHLVIQLYSYSHLSIVMVLLAIACSWNTFLLTAVSFISFFWMFGYSAHVLKRVFELDFGRLVLKSMLFLSICGVLMPAGVIVYGIYIGAKSKDGTLEDSPINTIIKESFEKGQSEKRKKDSLQKMQDSTKVNKTLVLDSISR